MSADRTRMTVPVAIVGGGPAGLCASILLSRHGVASLLVDGKPGTADHPRAGYHNIRTMELFRQWGIEEAIRDKGFPIDEQNTIYWLTRLFGGTELGRLRGQGADDAPLLRSVSPTTAGFCSQDVCEPILLELARRSPLADIRFGHTMTEIDISDDQAVLTVVGEDGDAYHVRASYVIAADGAHSTVARRLGLTYEGGEVLGHMMNVQFHAPGVRRRLSEREGFMYCISNPEIRGIWGTLDRTDRWVLNFFADTTGRPDVDRDFPHDRCRQLVRAAAGDPDLDVEILTVNPWAMSARIADTYRLGPVLFAGDAAHLFPPTGGLGMNTAVQDVHNLAWKIAHVLTGRAGPGLLDTYDPERRLVGRRNMEQSVVNAMRMAASGAAFDPDKLEALDDPVRGADLRQEVAAAIELQRDEFQTLGQTLGFTYDSDAVVSDGTEPDAPADAIRDYRPSGRPGARAPHVWIRSAEGRVSTLDLFDKHHVLLVPTTTSPWVTSAVALGIRHFVVTEAGDEPPEQSWLDTYGITPTGAVLVRPDGHIAWRAHDAGSCDTALASAHEQLTSAATSPSGHHN